MSRETKVGMMMFALLVGVFGFLGYKRYYQPSEGMANQEISDVSPNSTDGTREEIDDESNSARKRIAGFTSRRNERKETTIDFSSDDSTDFDQPVVKKASLKKSKSLIPSYDDDLEEEAPKATRQKPQAKTERAREVEAAVDFFAENRDNGLTTRQVAAIAETASDDRDSDGSDPFGGDEADEKDESTQKVAAEPVRRAKQLSVPIDLDEQESTEEAEKVDDSNKWKQPATAKPKRPESDEDRFGKSDRSDSSSNRSDFGSTRTREPARIQQSSDFDVDSEPPARNQRRIAPEPVARESFSPEMTNRRFDSARGTEYVIQPNDNYWTISRKRYGVGRYYMALAKHNEKLIPDPKMMRPGVSISTPDSEFLDRRYAEVIPKPAGTSDQTTSDSQIQMASATEPDSYVVQSSDNFWTISKKQYGTGAYFMALQRHNQQVVADPKAMKPGMTISTPDAELLKQRYPDLIPKTDQTDEGSMSVSNQARRTTDSDNTGFFVSSEGTPMYRVGDRDTLTDIAKNHLGRSSRWVQIFEMNRNLLQDGNQLKIGTVLRLPADATRVQVAGSSRFYR